MAKIRIKPGYGPHIIGETKYVAGQVFDSEKDLHLTNPRKFQLVLEDGVPVTRSQWGSELTAEVAIASQVPKLRVFLNGRRYRLVLDGRPLTTEPTRLKSLSEVEDAIKKLIAEAKGEEALDESELEDDDEETEAEGTEEETEAEGEEDGIVGKPKKKKKKSE